MLHNSDIVEGMCYVCALLQDFNSSWGHYISCLIIGKSEKETENTKQLFCVVTLIGA